MFGKFHLKFKKKNIFLGTYFIFLFFFSPMCSFEKLREQFINEIQLFMYTNTNIGSLFSSQGGKKIDIESLNIEFAQK